MKKASFKKYLFNYAWIHKIFKVNYVSSIIFNQNKKKIQTKDLVNLVKCV